MRTEARDLGPNDNTMYSRGVWWTVFDYQIDTYFSWVSAYSDNIQYDSHYSAYYDENSDEGRQFMMVVDAGVVGESYDPANPGDVDVWVQSTSSVLGNGAPVQVAYNGPLRSYGYYINSYPLTSDDIPSEWETKYGFRFSGGTDCLNLASKEIPAGSLRKLPLIQNFSIEGNTLSWDQLELELAEGAEIGYRVRILKFEDDDGDGQGEAVGIPDFYWLHDSGLLFFGLGESTSYTLPAQDVEGNPFQAGKRYALRVDAWEQFNGQLTNRSIYYPNFLYPGVADSATVSPGAVLGENVTIGEGTTIDKFSAIGDNALIGENVDIDKNVAAGGNVKIGDGTEVKQGTELGNDVVIGPNVIINRDVVIGDSVQIGVDCPVATSETDPPCTVIGKESKISDGAVIGKNVHVGKQVIVEQDAVIPDGTIVPAGTTWP